MHKPTPIHALSVVALLMAAPLLAANAPMTERMTLPRTDFVNAGVDGIGAAMINGGGVGTIELGGVSGTVTLALLYWEGIDIDEPDDDFVGGDADYDEADIEFDGVPVTGIQLYAHGANNGWPFTAPNEPPPPPSAGLYRADVTTLIQAGGNRAYAISGLADGGGHSANGASLIVYFDDGDPANDVHVVHYEGMQSNDDGHWQFPFNVEYGGGAVEAIFHVADGQTSLDDGTLQFNVSPGLPGSNPDVNRVSFTSLHYDGLPLFGGESVPGMGFPRAGNGSRLWDIRRLPLTAGFGPPGAYEVAIQLGSAQDALALVIAQIVTAADADEGNLMLSPTPFDFGDVVRDTVGPSQTFTLRNLQPHPITIAGAPAVYAPMYQVIAQTCSGQVLAPGATCTVDVACAPTGLNQSPPSALVIKWTPPGSPSPLRSTYAPLACFGIATAEFSRLVIAPPACDFGRLAGGNVSPARHFIASNTGNLPLTVTEVREITAGFTIQSEACEGLVLQPGESCPVSVAFTPPGTSTGGGVFTRNLALYYSASDDAEDNVRSELTGLVIGTTGDRMSGDGFDPPDCG